MSGKGASLRRRVGVVLVGFVFVMASLGGRLSYIQVGQGEELMARILKMHAKSIPLTAPRGDMLDRTGWPLATSVTAESLYAIPIEVQDKPAAAAQLAPILGRQENEVLSLLMRRASIVWIGRRLPSEQVEKIRLLKIHGIGFATETRRFYPEGPLTGAMMGIVGVDGGLEGLEKVYDKQLKGQNGAVRIENDAKGRLVPNADVRIDEPIPGATLVLTLDRGLQLVAQKEAERAMLETKAKRAVIAIMDVATGGMLAFAQAPGFDPNLGANSDPQLRRIWPIADTLAPGSIFKPVTASAALDAGAITMQTGFVDGGSMQVADRTIHNWNNRGFGTGTLVEVMSQSSNVGFATIGLKLGIPNFYKYLRAFGMTDKTGIDIPGEAKGIQPSEKRATQLDLAIMAFGQTLTVTPLQMLNAIAAIGNHGQLMRPHFAKEFRLPDGTVLPVEPEPVRQVVKPAVADQVVQLMEGVVSKGTGKNAQVANYAVGGKTGTAQKFDKGVKQVGKYTASFVGLAPIPNPKVAVLISVDEPQGVFYGGSIAAPVFGEMMLDVLTYLKVPPTSVTDRRPADVKDPTAGE